MINYKKLSKALNDRIEWEENELLEKIDDVIYEIISGLSLSKYINSDEILTIDDIYGTDTYNRLYEMVDSTADIIVDEKNNNIWYECYYGKEIISENDLFSIIAMRNGLICIGRK